jgi:hypothetical protein
MVKSKLIGLVLLLGPWLLPASAWAWARGGHMVTGAIVYDLMKQDSPAALARIIELLEKHPDEKFVKRLEGVEPEQRGRVLVMYAARWPDDIRDNPDYHHSKWHYIDFPFKPKGQPATVTTAEPDAENALVAIRTNLSVLNQPQATDAEKAVAICWLLHVIGDIHQPLHTVSLFTTEYPAPFGDEGGNKFKIRARADAKPISLHRFWDDLIAGSDNLRETGNKAIELRHQYPRSKLKELGKQISATEAERWVQEGVQMAQSVVYRQGKLPGSPDENRAPVLPDGYAKQVQPLAQKRAVLASYRIAATLSKAIGPAAKQNSSLPAAPATKSKPQLATPPKRD